MDFLHVLLLITIAILIPIAFSKRPRDTDKYHPSPELEARAKARALQIAMLPFARRLKSIHDLIITLVREKEEAVKELDK